MSNVVYPSLLGLTPGISRSPVWTTAVHKSVSGREVRGTYQFYPMYDFELSYEFLKDGVVGTEFAQLVGFFNARGGSWDSFLFTDPADSSVTAMNFGTGDASTTVFQLTRSFGAGGFTAVEPVQNLNSTPSIFVNGTLKTLTTDYTISSSGVVTFVTAPAAAAALTWTGTYYYRCRFRDDTLQFQKIVVGLWEVKKVGFRASLANVL